MAKRKKSRVYTRQQGSVKRYYADFRDYADVDGKREALVSPGCHRATDDSTTAKLLADKRLAELIRLRRQRAIVGDEIPSTTLEAYAAYHLIQEKRANKFSDSWLRQMETYLTRAVGYFGVSRELMSITVPDVIAWVQALRISDAKGKVRSAQGGTQRKHLNALSNLYARARSEGLGGRIIQPGSRHHARGETPRAGGGGRLP